MVRMLKGIAALEQSLAVPQKVKQRVTIKLIEWPRNSLLGIHTQDK